MFTRVFMHPKYQRLFSLFASHGHAMGQFIPLNQ